MKKHLIDDFLKNIFRENIFIKNILSKNAVKCTLKVHLRAIL